MSFTHLAGNLARCEEMNSWHERRKLESEERSFWKTVRGENKFPNEKFNKFLIVHHHPPLSLPLLIKNTHT